VERPEIREKIVKTESKSWQKKLREKVVEAKYYEIQLEKPERMCILFEPFVLFDCVNCYFLFFPAALADAFFLNIPEPF